MDFEIKENTNVIIVTGVAGFIGFSLTLCLLKQGVTVIGIDNLTGGDTVSLSVSERSFKKRDPSLWTSPEKFVVLGDQT